MVMVMVMDRVLANVLFIVSDGLNLRNEDNWHLAQVSLLSRQRLRGEVEQIQSCEHFLSYCSSIMLLGSG